MNKLTESELAVFDEPAAPAPAAQAPADDWGWGEDAPSGPAAIEMVQTQCDAGHLHGKKPKGTRVRTSECPACKLLGIEEKAVVIPPDAPLNDATLPPPEKKTRKPRKGKDPSVDAPLYAAEAEQPRATSVQVSEPVATSAPDAESVFVSPVPTLLRDQFATAALQGLCALEMYQSHPCGAVAENAYAIADAMLKARG